MHLDEGWQQYTAPSHKTQDFLWGRCRHLGKCALVLMGDSRWQQILQLHCC